MDAFVAKHEKSIRGVLSCFDRVLFRGYVPLTGGYAMAEFLQRKQVHRRSLKAFLLTQAARVKQHALSLATATQRPYQYLTGPCRKEELARQSAARDGITDGLVCIFSVLEPCRTFSLVWKEPHPFVQPAWRKCLHLYCYFLDRQLGLRGCRCSG
jgi:hypothetical protein